MDTKDLVTKDARQNQKHFINTKLVDIIEYRQSRKWYVSIAVVGMFSLISNPRNGIGLIMYWEHRLTLLITI